MMKKSNSKAIFYVLVTFAVTSCFPLKIIKDDGFSGGNGSMVIYDIKLSREMLEIKTDSLSSNHVNGLNRLYHTYGYDSGDFRSYMILSQDSVLFDIRLYGNNKDGWKGKSNLSAIGITSIRYKNYRFYSSKKMTSEEKNKLKELIMLVEEKYIDLLR